jgi:hypothetical protein
VGLKCAARLGNYGIKSHLHDSHTNYVYAAGAGVDGILWRHGLNLNVTGNLFVKYVNMNVLFIGNI